MKILKALIFPALFMLLLTAVLGRSATFAAENEPPVSPEVMSAMQPNMDSYKLAGVIGIIADKNGKIPLQEYSRLCRR